MMQALVILDIPDENDVKSPLPPSLANLVHTWPQRAGAKRLAEAAWLLDVPEAYPLLVEISGLCYRHNLTHHVVFLNEQNQWAHSSRTSGNKT